MPWKLTREPAACVAGWGGFVLAYNHPSGSLDPSSEDVEFTRSIHRAGALMGIELFDHLVASSVLFATRSEAELREWLDGIDLADYLFRAQGAPVLLSEEGPRVVD